MAKAQLEAFKSYHIVSEKVKLRFMLPEMSEWEREGVSREI